MLLLLLLLRISSSRGLYVREELFGAGGEETDDDDEMASSRIQVAAYRTSTRPGRECGNSPGNDQQTLCVCARLWMLANISNLQ